MEVDQDPHGQGTPPGTPFQDGFTPATTRGHTTTGPIGSVRTGNYFTPLYTETQETDHSNDNANQPPPTHEDVSDADLADAEVAATANDDDAGAEAAASDAANFIARLAAETEAAKVDEAVAAEAAVNAAARRSA